MTRDIYKLEIYSRTEDQIISCMQHVMRELGFDSIYVTNDNPFTINIRLREYEDPKFMDYLKDKLEELGNVLGQALDYEIVYINTEECSTHPDRTKERINDKVCVCVPEYKGTEDAPYEIVITPSTASGYSNIHTSLAIDNLLANPTDGIVVDIGCGGGVLSILAKKLGASTVYCCDTDKAAKDALYDNIYESGLNRENFIFTRTFSEILFMEVVPDVIVANLTGPIIISLMDEINKMMTNDTKLLLSGFTDHSLRSIILKLNELDLEYTVRHKYTTCSMVVKKKS